MAQVIINDIAPYTQTVSTAGQTVYSTDWTANYPSDVVVYYTPVGVAPDDATQILTSNAYNVAFIGSDNIVQVTLVTPAVNTGDVVTITRQTPADRENLYTNTNFTPSMLNNDFGILTLVDQQAQLVNQQIAPRYNYSASINVPVDTILPILAANQTWVKNSTNTAIIPIIPLSGSDVAGVQFIIQTANALVPDSQSLGTLTTGILKNNVVSSVGTLTISPSLTSLDSQSITTDSLPYGVGNSVFGVTSFSAFGRSLVADANQTDAQTTLGLLIGTNVQGWTATLQSLGVLGTTADRIAYTTGIDTWAETPVTTLSLALLADSTQAAAAATLGVLPLSGGTMTGSLILSGPATIGTEPVTLAQAQALFLNEQLACDVATTTDMPTWTYNNGSSGVGATLTAPTNGASTFDGITPSNGQRVFVINQTSNPAWQGPYTIVQGTGSSVTVLTRGTDWDQASEMNPGDIFAVVLGTLYGASQWMFAQTASITVGTTALTFTQLAGQGALLKVNNLSDLTNVTTAVSNLGLTIGTNTQAFNANLQSISGLGAAANQMIYTTGVDTWAATTANAFGRSFLGLTASLGGVIYSTASAAAVLAGTTTSNQMLQSGSSAAPAWSTSTWPQTTTINQLLYSNATNVVVGLATGNNGVLITGTTGIPSWLADGTTGQVLTATTGGPASWATLPSGGTVTSVSVTTALGISGTVATATTTPAITIAATGRWLNRQWLTSGTTYNPTAGTKTAFLRGVGGGGGTGGTSTAGGNGGQTTFTVSASNVLVCNGGIGAAVGGAPSLGGAAGTGSFATAGNPGLPGDAGVAGQTSLASGNGANSLLGSGAIGIYNAIGTGKNAAANTGGGASGMVSSTGFCYSGAGSGSYSEYILTAVTGTYTYAIGAGGTAGSGDEGGGVGGSGIIIIDEYS
jgi:hypothetical protein